MGFQNTQPLRKGFLEFVQNAVIIENVGKVDKTAGARKCFESPGTTSLIVYFEADVLLVITGKGK
jgi:flagellar biosynthesis regulator FlbT